MLLLLSSLALAHRPHAVMTMTAAPEDMDTSGRVWAVLDPNRISMLMRSDDAGVHWQFYGGEVTDDILVDGAYDTTEGLSRLVILGEAGTVWWSEDEAATWDKIPGLTGATASHIAVAEGRYLVASDAGLLTGVIGETLASDRLEAGTEFAYTGLSPGFPLLMAAVTSPGELLVSTDGSSFANLGMVDGHPATAVAWQEDLLLVGTDEGMYRYDGLEITPCGALPVTWDDSYDHYIVRLEATLDGRTLVGTGREAVFVSYNDCQTWTLHSPGIAMSPEYGGVGNARSPRDAYRGLVASGARYVVGGFNGMAASTDGGSTWTMGKVIPSDYYRGVALAPNFPVDPRFFAGLYGGGASWTRDGGVSWEGSSVGIMDDASYDLAPSSDVATSHVVFYAGLDDAYRSTDDGKTWTMLDAPMERVRLVISIGKRVFALGENSSSGVEGQVAYSDDYGDTWKEWMPMYEVMDNSTPRDLEVGVLDGQTAILITTDSEPGLLGSFDDGDTWQWLYLETGKDLGAGGTIWNESRLVYASTAMGVQLSDDKGQSWRAPQRSVDGAPRAMIQGDDGTLFVATRMAQIWRSEDGGETWAPVGERLFQAVHDMAISKNFAQYGIVMLGTQEGAYWSNDRGESWNLLRRYERFEDTTYHLICKTAAESDCGVWEDASWGLGGGYAMEAGDRLEMTIEGDSFSLLGPQTGDGQAVVYVDGEEFTTLTANGSPLRVTGLPSAGWKDIRIEVLLTGPSGFRVDAAEVWGEGNPLPIPELVPDTGGPDDSVVWDDTGTGRPPKPESEARDTGGGILPGTRCSGCNSASTISGLGVLLALLIRRR